MPNDGIGWDAEITFLAVDGQGWPYPLIHFRFGSTAYGRSALPGGFVARRPHRDGRAVNLRGTIAEHAMAFVWGDHVEAPKGLPEARMVPARHLPFVMVAERAGEVVGFTTVIANGTNGTAVLEGLFVAPAAWRKGVGARLLVEAERRAHASGATHLCRRQ